jgi:hypothetical protein
METKVCTKCGEEKPIGMFNTQPHRKRGIRSECKKCQYKQQELRKKKKPWQIKAKGKARDAVLKGMLIKPSSCEKCHQNKPLEKHHDDYNKPLEVVWLCHQCHVRLHNPNVTNFIFETN